ncbi:NTPCR [Symbiodinium microadriaticum]|nr:NTPCR [Symbiodinium microadriaticum]
MQDARLGLSLAKGGAAALLTRPPPQGGAAALLTRSPPQELLLFWIAFGVVCDVDVAVEVQPPSASASAQDWEDDYDLPVQKDLGDGWDGYGELEEFETLASEPPAKEAPAEAATTAPAKLEEAPEEATPAAPKEEPRKQPRHIFIASQPGVGKTTLVHKLLEKLREEDGEGGVDVRGFYTEEVRDPANPKQRLGFDVVRVGCLEPDEQTRSVLAREGKAPPTVGKYSVDVAAFEAFALPALEPPKEEEFQLPENPRLFKLSDGTEKAVSLLYEPTDEEEGANSRIRLEFGEVLNVPPSSLREAPEGWKPEDEEEEEEPVPRLCIVDEVGKMGLLSVQFPKTLARVLKEDTVLATGVQMAKGQRDPEPVEEIKKSPGARVVKLTRGNRDAVVEQTYAFLRESLGLGPPGTGKPKPRRVDKKKRKEEERRAKEQAEREAREREEKEREEAAEKEKAARKERQLAKEKARAERLAKEKAEREVEAAKARAERKRRAEARQKAAEDAKNGLVPCVEHDDEEDVEAVAPSFDLVEDIDVVEEKAAPPRKRRKGQPSPVSSAGSSPPELPASPEAGLRTERAGLAEHAEQVLELLEPKPGRLLALTLGPGAKCTVAPRIRGFLGMGKLRRQLVCLWAPSQAPAAAMALLATTCRSHLSVARLGLWLRRSASSQVQAEGAADVQNEKPSSRTSQRKGPGALIDFEFIDRALESHRHARDASDTWSGLRATVEMTLSRGNLDTHLWWRHAADARKRLLEWKSTVQTSEDAIDATAVIVSCARAEVEPRTGVYASWIRAVLASNARRHARPLFSVGEVSAAAAFLGKAGALPPDARFWHDGFPSIVRVAGGLSSSEMAQATAAYACVSLSAAAGHAGHAVFDSVESQLPFVEVSAHEAAVLIWAHRRCGRLSASMFRDLWVRSLDSRLSEVSPELLAALAHAMASVGLPMLSKASSAAPASQLLQSLSRRSKKPASVDLLCRSAGVLADAGLVMPSDAWMVVEAAAPILAQISDLGRAELFRMLALLGIDDEPVLSLLQAGAPRQGLLAETPQAFELSAAGLPTAETLGRGRESPAASQAAAAFLEASALLASGPTSPDLIDGSAEALAGASASTQLRSVLALTSLGHSTAAAKLEAELWDRPLLCYDAAEAEELLRLLPALASRPSRSLLHEIIGFLTEDGPRSQLSADQGASAVLSCSLLDTTMDVWQLAVDGEGMVPEAISFPALLQLCLAAVLEASALERLDQVGVLPLLRQKSEQRRSRCSTGAELVLLQLLQAVSQRDYDWPLELISKVCPSVAVRPRPWLHSAEASKRTDAWLQLLLADDDGRSLQIRIGRAISGMRGDWVCEEAAVLKAALSTIAGGLKEEGAVFSMFNIFFLAVFYWDLSQLVPALCHIFTVVLLAGGATRYAVPQTADRNVDLLSQDAIKSAVETISKFLNVISEKVRDVVLWTSSEMTITAVFVLQLVRLVSPYFGAFFFVWMIGNVLFVAPYVWKAKNAELHQYVGPYIKQAVAMKDDLLAKVPKYTDVVKEECAWHLGSADVRLCLHLPRPALICGPVSVSVPLCAAR